MSPILGIDPGTTTGWCLYDAVQRRVMAAGHFAETWTSDEFRLARKRAAQVVIEQPVAHGPTRPQVVECAWIAGQLKIMTGADPITRREVKLLLTEAVQRDVVVKDDASAWAALKLLHGDGCDKKGGAIYEVTSHARAALAAIVAWQLRKEQKHAAT